MLGDAEGVINGAGIAAAVELAGTLDVFGGHFADFGGPLGSELPDVGKEGFAVGGALGNEAFIDEAVALDDVGHGEEQGDIRSYPDGQVEVSHFREACFPGIDHDHGSAVGEGALEAGGSDGVALRHVGANGKNDIRLLHIRKRIAHCASTDSSCQTGNCRGVSTSRAVVYVIGPVGRPDVFLHRVGGLVRGASGSNSVNGVPAILVFHFLETFSSAVERFVPFALVELAVIAADKRLGEAVVVLNEVEGVLALDAERAFVGGSVHGGLDADDLVAFAQHVDGATHAAIRTDGAGLLDLAFGVGVAQGFLVTEGTGGAGLDALSAEGAVGVAQVVIELGDDLGVEPAVHHVDGVVAFALGADADAAVAGNAVVVVAEDKRILVTGVGGAGLFAGEATGAGAVTIDQDGHFLGGVTAQGIDVDVAVLGRD